MQRIEKPDRATQLREFQNGRTAAQLRDGLVSQSDPGPVWHGGMREVRRRRQRRRWRQQWNRG
ncbi:MAG: hypothetical protein M3Q10_18200 [Chloroflexota bacterium]|nr:hypothetical protein [Chloroflexota bacterium]